MQSAAKHDGFINSGFLMTVFLTRHRPDYHRQAQLRRHGIGLANIIGNNQAGRRAKQELESFAGIGQAHAGVAGRDGIGQVATGTKLPKPTSEIIWHW